MVTEIKPFTSLDGGVFDMYESSRTDPANELRHCHKLYRIA